MWFLISTQSLGQMVRHRACCCTGAKAQWRWFLKCLKETEHRIREKLQKKRLLKMEREDCKDYNNSKKYQNLQGRPDQAKLQRRNGCV